MTKRTVLLATVAILAFGGTAQYASAQAIEIVGSRAMGMGGAFVAVASDSSATWWNPAGLAAGPFIDLALAQTLTEQPDTVPAWRDRSSGFAIAAPMLGFSYYRLRLTDIRPLVSTADGVDSREDGTAGVAVRSISISQLGPTVLQTLFPGVHAGTTLKYVRGTLRPSGSGTSEESPGTLLDAGDDLEGGEAKGRFDLDVGLLATAGPVRLGAVARNLREPEFDGGFRLPRQIRVGAALDLEQAGGPPLVLALDGDIREYETTRGARQVVAVGVEQWLFTRRVGVRVGGRFNRKGAEERVATAGISVAVRSGMYLEGHYVRGRTDEDRGWGTAMRVSF